MIEQLVEKIENKTAKIGVIGLGYVGLPLSLLFSKQFKVVGFDIAEEKVDMLRAGKSYIIDVSENDLRQAKNFHATHDEKDLLDCDFKIICVPTPLKNNKPDLSFVLNASIIVSKNLKKGQFVIIESTVYPGATKEDVVPVLSKSGLLIGSDVGVAFSPERVDPCNKKYRIENTPKVVGGLNQVCTDIAAKLYENIIDAKIVKVSNCEAAEATKILENTFREVNIGLINELALLFEKMGIDIWEVIEAASSKPFGFMPFYPGPGVGGHCTPIDPVYLSYKARDYDFETRFINLSTEINEFMKAHVIELAKIGLKKIGKDIDKSTIAVFGLSYKKNINDTREAPSIKILEELSKQKAKIKVYDPFVPSIETVEGKFVSEKSVENTIDTSDCIIFLVDHDAFSHIQFKNKKVVIDCKNIFDKNKLKDIIYYGLGKPI